MAATALLAGAQADEKKPPGLDDRIPDLLPFFENLTPGGRVVPVQQAAPPPQAQPAQEKKLPKEAQAIGDLFQLFQEFAKPKAEAAAPEPKLDPAKEVVKRFREIVRLSKPDPEALAKQRLEIIKGAMAKIVKEGVQARPVQPLQIARPALQVQQIVRPAQAQVQQIVRQLRIEAQMEVVPQLQVQQIELDPEQIFDGGLFVDADVEIVNGRVVIKDASKVAGLAVVPDPAGDQVLELTDGSQLHGKLVTLSKSEVVWQRADAKEPLIFAPQDVRRLTLEGLPVGADKKSNTTVKLQGSDWLAGELSEMRDGKFLMRIGTETQVEVARDKVEWLMMTPSGTPPPDTYDGPVGPMGLAGWDAAAETGGSWDYADGALVAKNASAIARQFDTLSDKVDIQFTAGDGGSSNRGLTLWLQPGARTRGYAKGSCYLRFQAGNVNANVFNGEQMKNFSANIEEGRDEKKVTKYRLLHDRKEGRLVIIVNGKQIADWDLPEIKDPAPGGTFSWQPSYWSSNMAWTLSSVRVQPWDGTLEPDAKDEDKGKDLLKIESRERKAGTLEGITPEVLKFSGADVARKEPLFLRLAPPANAEPNTGGVARVWLASRGEFDVTGIGFRDGVLKVRTAFSGDLALPAATVKAIEFPHKPAPAPPPTQAEGGDLVIFKNGDQLKGTLLAASHDQPLRWKPVKGEKPVEFAPDRLAGILLAARKEAPPAANGAAACFHNGDWIAGKMLGLDKDSLHLGTGVAGDLRLSRASLRTLYFAPTGEDGALGEAPVWDGASQRDLWTRGATVPGYWGGEQRKKDDKKSSPWKYLDGAFTLLSSANRNSYGNGPNLGRTFDNLPNKVEVSFELSTTKGPASYAIQLFFDDNKPGLMVQGGWDSAYLYDMSPKRNAGAVFNQPQQLDFGEKVGSDGNRRHFRFLGDRTNGRLWMYVNGHFVGQLNRRSGSDNAKTGKGIAIIPQPMMSRVTVSNLWVAPWSGAVPALSKSEKAAEEKKGDEKEAPKPGVNEQKPPAADPKKEDKVAKEDAKDAPGAPEAPEKLVPLPDQDAIALNNGDETLGKVETASAEALRVKCDVGDLQIPLKRAVMVEFGGKAPATKGGIRFRLASKGAVTVQSFRIEDGKVVCESDSAGQLTFPLAAVSEIVFQPNESRPFESIPVKDAGGENDETIIFGGGRIQGRILIR